MGCLAISPSGDIVTINYPNRRIYYPDLAKRIEDEINIEFLPKNTHYDNNKNQYIKILKQIYQIGFIYFVGEFKFNDFYIPPFLIKANKLIKELLIFKGINKNNFIENRNIWHNIFSISDIVYIVGGPGYGKSLFLRNLIINYSKLNLLNSNQYLPIYCDLKTFYSNGNPNKKTLIDFLQESMINITGVQNITADFIEYYLKRGRCLILLDALDEVPKDVRTELHKKVLAYFANCNPNNKICITSRDRGFIPQENIDLYHIGPLTSLDIEEYLDKMIVLKKFKREDKATFLKQAKVLIEKDFLNNFLILSLLVNIYKSEKELPENKIDLYKKCFDYIAKKREEEKSKIGYDWKNIYPLMKDSTFINLSILAAPNNSDVSREDVENLLKEQYKNKYTDEAAAECSIKEFLEFCSNRTELFVPSSVDDKFKFFHRSFFEYFYSRYIHQQSSAEKMYTMMTAFDIDSEVFELTIALVKEDNEIKYQELLDYIYVKVEEDFNDIHPDFTAFSILTLVMQIIDDFYYIDKYLNLILIYDKLMTDSRVLAMNQQLLIMWLEKGIGDNIDKKNAFKKVYEPICINYILLLFSKMKSNPIPIDLSGAENKYDAKSLERILIKNISRSIPFYISVYQFYFDMHKTLEAFTNKEFERWINSQKQLTKKQVSSLKKGRLVYKSIEDTHRLNLFKYLI